MWKAKEAEEAQAKALKEAAAGSSVGESKTDASGFKVLAGDEKACSIEEHGDGLLAM